jgi:signal transduction histidine kinase
MEARDLILVCVCVPIAFIGLLLWIHLRQASSLLKVRHEARLAERDRIARELHDTLLQSTEGLILKVYSAVQQLPPGSPTRALLMRSVDQAEELAIEGRQKLLGLRHHLPSRLELSQAVAALGLELSLDSTTAFLATKEGRVRELTGVAWDESFSVAREAMKNAFMHARASHIEAVVTYKSSTLMLRIRDDGRGLPDNVTIPFGKPGHFGLRAMFERARQLRGRLAIETGAEQGTMVSLVVPGSVAYRRRSTAFWFRPLGKRSLYRGIVEMHDEVKNMAAPNSIRR